VDQNWRIVQEACQECKEVVPHKTYACIISQSSSNCNESWGQTYKDLIGKNEEEDGMAKANSNVTICDTESILGVCKPIEMEEGDGSQAKCNAKRTLVHHSTNSDNK